jgi:hypothetical protein
MTYFLKSRPGVDSSIRVRVWTGNQLLPKDIVVSSIRQLTDREAHLPLDPNIKTLIDTTEGVLHVADTTASLVKRLNKFLHQADPEVDGPDVGDPDVGDSQMGTQRSSKEVE